MSEYDENTPWDVLKKEPQQIPILMRFVATGLRNGCYSLSDFGRSIQEKIYELNGSRVDERELLRDTAQSLSVAADVVESLLQTKGI